MIAYKINVYKYILYTYRYREKSSLDISAQTKLDIIIT